MTNPTPRFAANRSHNGKSHVYSEYHFHDGKGGTFPGWIARCSCPGVNNGHTQAHGAMLPLSGSTPNLCKSGARLVAQLVTSGTIPA